MTRCAKCGLQHRIVVYRRTEPPTYLCATCVSEPIEFRQTIRLSARETRTLDELLANPPEPTPALRALFSEDPARPERKKAYQGFRLPHDRRES